MEEWSKFKKKIEPTLKSVESPKPREKKVKDEIEEIDKTASVMKEGLLEFNKLMALVKPTKEQLQIIDTVKIKEALVLSIDMSWLDGSEDIKLLDKFKTLSKEKEIKEELVKGDKN